MNFRGGEIMKRLAMLIMTISVVTSSGTPPTIINLSDQNYLAIIPQDCAQDEVDVSTPTPCQAPSMVISTGPFTMRVSTDPASDCYEADGVFPNGALINERWVPCQ